MKTFRLNYIELIGEDTERSSELIIETKDIKRTLARFMGSKRIVSINAEKTNTK